MPAITMAALTTVVALGLVCGDPGCPRPGDFTRVKRGRAGLATTYRPPPEWRRPTSASTITGDLSYYAAGKMATAAARRGLSLAGYVGGVALMRRGDLGRVVWLKVAGPDPGEWLPWAGPFLVVDCAGRLHYAGLVKRERAAEVSRATWVAWDLPEDLVEVVVSFEDPASGPGW